jgi:phosphoserine phosphatase
VLNRPQWRVLVEAFEAYIGEGPGRSAEQQKAIRGGVDMRCAIYARVSTLEQEPENQLAELRRAGVGRVEVYRAAATDCWYSAVRGLKRRSCSNDRKR